MGRWRLLDFRTELQSITGGEVTDVARLDLYVNTGQDLLCGMVEFNSLKCIDKIQLTPGRDRYPNPSGMLGVRQAVFQGQTPDISRGKLVHTAPERWTQFVKEINKNRRPERWTSDANGFKVWPPPDKIYSLLRAFLKQPQALVANTDVTQFNPHWDVPILYMAAKALLKVLDQESRSVSFHNSAVLEINALLQDTELTSSDVTDGLWVAENRTQLLAPRTAGI